jgi:hypothetical protein
MSTLCLPQNAEQRRHQLRREITELVDAIANASDGGQITRLRLMLASRQRELQVLA